ncbi:MAG: triple tyrosine motif-containing protein, partial [Acidobacteriota bacterium]
MRSAHGSGGVQASAWRRRDGSLWFATLEGATRVDSESLQATTSPPDTYIEDVLIDGRRWQTDLAKPVVLEPGDRNLEIRYSAIELGLPERLRFRYRLEGYDNGWTEVGSRRTAYFTSPPAGELRFRVAASLDGSHWHELGTVLELQVRPPFHRTPTFLAACGVIAALRV